MSATLVEKVETMTGTPRRRLRPDYGRAVCLTHWQRLTAENIPIARKMGAEAEHAMALWYSFGADTISPSAEQPVEKMVARSRASSMLQALP